MCSLMRVAVAQGLTLLEQHTPLVVDQVKCDETLNCFAVDVQSVLQQQQQQQQQSVGGSGRYRGYSICCQMPPVKYEQPLLFNASQPCNPLEKILAC